MSCSSADRSNSPALALWLLRRFHVEVDGTPVDPARWRRRKVRHVLAMLGLAPGHTIHREQILEELWPHADPVSADNSLHQTLHLARRALDETVEGAGSRIMLVDDLVSLAGDPWVDVLAFEADASRARSGDRCARRAALARLTGELLPEDRFEAWTTARRDAIEATWLELTLAEAHAHHADAEPKAAIELLHRIVAADPLHEEAHRLLMRIHAEAGKRAAALQQYATLETALRNELDVAPTAETRALRERIVADDLSPPPAPARPPPTNIPSIATSLIGREREIGEVQQLVGHSQLVTLTGPGGAGKTRLALESASRMSGEFPDGTWLVDLTGLADPALVAQAVASTFGIVEGPDQPLDEAIERSLADRHLLLVLDNCEHLIDACAAFVARLLERAPRIRVLTTSREPLRVPGETTWLVPSLSLPDREARTLDALQHSECVQLYLQRARAVRPDLAADDTDAEALVQICHRLDGIPLAVELAAARARALTNQEIAARLDDRFNLLAAGSRIAPTRQQTLKDAIGWSHDLLDGDEQRLFRRLAVFPGSFDLEAAERVAGGADLPAGSVLDLVARLVDKSLLVAEPAGPITRYRLLESVRAFAAEQLSEAGEWDATATRHATHFHALATTATAHLRGPDQIAWLERLRAERRNLRTAIQWYRATDELEHELELVASLYWYWHRSAEFFEGRSQLRISIERSSACAGPARIGVLLGGGVLCVAQSWYDDGAPWLREAAALAERHGDDASGGVARTWLVWERLFRQGPHAALPLAWQAHADAHSTDDPWGRALASLALGFATGEAGELDTAHRVFTDAAASFDACGDLWGRAAALTELARIAFRRDERGALAFAEQAVAASRLARNQWQAVQALGLKVEIRRAQGDLDRATRLGAEAAALAYEIGQHVSAAWILRDLGHVALLRGDPSTAARHFAESYDIFLKRDFGHGKACTLVGIAAAAAGEDRMTAAARLLGRAEHLLGQVGTSLPGADADVARAVRDTARVALGDARFRSLLEEGRTADPIGLVAEFSTRK